MRVVVQRVREASVKVDGEVVGNCDRGVVVLVGVASVDRPETAQVLARKVARLRIFENSEGRLDLDLLNVGGEALVVSQFTLVADTNKGTRPSFTDAARPDVAQPLFEEFCEALEREGVRLGRGMFGARMELALVNDGPVTIVLDA
jgi:D-tyrosyl-tRNA(Tyr) deacylase